MRDFVHESSSEGLHKARENRTEERRDCVRRVIGNNDLDVVYEAVETHLGDYLGGNNVAYNTFNVIILFDNSTVNTKFSIEILDQREMVQSDSLWSNFARRYVEDGNVPYLNKLDLSLPAARENSDSVGPGANMLT